MSKRYSPQEENIYSSACIQALEQEYCSSCSAAVVSSCLVSSHGYGARVVSRIYNGGRRAVYTATVAAMLANNMALPAYGATTYVSAGETVSGATITSGNSQIIYSAGVASDTTISRGGMQEVSSGGKAYNTVQHSGGNVNVTVYGGDTENYVSGTNASGEAFGLQNGVASNFILYSGGSQDVFFGGVASNTTINEFGSQAVFSAVASDTPFTMYLERIR